MTQRPGACGGSADDCMVRCGAERTRSSSFATPSSPPVTSLRRLISVWRRSTGAAGVASTPPSRTGGSTRSPCGSCWRRSPSTRALRRTNPRFTRWTPRCGPVATQRPAPKEDIITIPAATPPGSPSSRVGPTNSSRDYPSLATPVWRPPTPEGFDRVRMPTTWQPDRLGISSVACPEGTSHLCSYSTQATTRCICRWNCARHFALGGVSVVSDTPDTDTRPRPDPADSLYLCGIKEGDRRGSNPRPSEPQSDALPTELRPPGAKILPGKRVRANPPTPETRSSCRPSCPRPRS